VRVNFIEDTLLSTECGDDELRLQHPTIHVEQNEQDVTPGNLVCNDVAGQTAASITKKDESRPKIATTISLL
jgi:hypothetical protein